MVLPFTSDQFFAVFGAYNEAVWPAQLFLLALAVLALVLVAFPRTWSGRAVSAILAFLWAWLALAYHLAFFASINPLAYVFAAGSAAGALVFVWHGVVRGRLRFQLARSAHVAAGVGRHRQLVSQSNDNLTEGKWVGFVEMIAPVVECHPEYRVFVELRRPFWKRGDARSNRALPVARVEVSLNTWELCVHAPGLWRRNVLGDSALTMREFHSVLEQHVPTAPHCRLVISDEWSLNQAELRSMAKRAGGRWSGVAPSEIGDGEFVARLDVPVASLEVRVTPRLERVRLLVSE